MNKRKIYTLIILSPFVLLMVTLFIGRYPIPMKEMAKVLMQTFTKRDIESLEPYYTIVWEIRMPRAIAAALVGASLSVSGVAFQSIFRNPLVNSSTLGVSPGAGFGAALGIILFGQSSLPIYVMAFIFGVIAVVLSYLIGRIYKSNHTIMLILGGVIVSSMFSSLTSFLKYVADPYNQLPAITFWLMGSFASVDYNKLLFSAIPMSIGIIGLIVLRWRINVLSLDDKEVHTLGINLALEKGLVIFFSTLATAGAVCLSGTIGWVGLVVPHIGRRLLGTNNKVLVPACCGLGASFLMIIDNISRTITGGEVPIGILTSLIGGPFFVYILKKTKGGAW
jgi:iron complex transport system permease protein